MGNEEIYIDASFNLHYPEGATQLDDFPDELRSVVHEHWGKYPPQHPLIKDAFGLLFGMLFIVALFGNLCVIYVFMGTKRLRTPSNFFIVNLAFSDLCMYTTQAFPLFINTLYSSTWMYGAMGCKVYAWVGAIFGTVSIGSMLIIGYDRYNVIVKGFNGTKITTGMAFGMIGATWVYAFAVCTPPFVGWGNYALEGQLISCSYDYLSEDMNSVSFVLYAYIFNYCVPVSSCIFFYSQIVMAVVKHEKALKEQAKKMNVESLRSGDHAEQSAELKIAKVAITNVFLWIAIWSPYATVVIIGPFGNRELLTPLATQIPSCAAKCASIFNPIMFALSHPKYREALGEKFPCLVVQEQVKAAPPAS
jgi:r-opsin